MRRILPILFLLALVACGPSKHVMHIDMRYPSKSGVDLGGKIPSVVYMESSDEAAAAFEKYGVCSRRTAAGPVRLRDHHGHT